jgi:hypothetical protein
MGEGERERERMEREEREREIETNDDHVELIKREGNTETIIDIYNEIDKEKINEL